MRKFFRNVKLGFKTDIIMIGDVVCSLVMRLPVGRPGQHSWSVAPGTAAQNGW